MGFLCVLLLSSYSSCLHTPIILLPINQDSCIMNLSTDQKCPFFFCSLFLTHYSSLFHSLTWTRQCQVWTWNCMAIKYLSPYIRPSSIRSSNWKITDCHPLSDSLLMFFSPPIFWHFVKLLLNLYRMFWITVRIIEKHCKDFGTCHPRNFF